MLFGILVSFGAGFLAEAILFRWLHDARTRLRDITTQTLGGKATTLGLFALLRVIGLAAFAVISVGVYWTVFDADPTNRITFFFYLSALMIFRVAAILSQFWHAPSDPDLRLPALENRSAQRLHRTFLTAVALGAVGFYTCAHFALLGIHGNAHGLLLILVGTATTVMLVMTFLGNRSAFASITALVNMT